MSGNKEHMLFTEVAQKFTVCLRLDCNTLLFHLAVTPFSIDVRTIRFYFRLVYRSRKVQQIAKAKAIREYRKRENLSWDRGRFRSGSHRVMSLPSVDRSDL